MEPQEAVTHRRRHSEGWRWLVAKRKAVDFPAPTSPVTTARAPRRKAYSRRSFTPWRVGETRISSVRKSAPKGSLVKAKKERYVCAFMASPPLGNRKEGVRLGRYFSWIPESV